MPCAAPCNRLPCDERCSKTLPCGHRCPGLCGEPCPEKHCQACGDGADQRVDLLEFKTYSEIDLDESPIVVLGCGHFFTAESLDGLARLTDVYSTDRTGKFVGLKEAAALLPVPCCPDCKRPMRQSATQRYNRIVNAAVLDETSQRFFVKGSSDLESLETRIEAAEKVLQAAPTSEAAEERRPSVKEWRKGAPKNPSSERYKGLKLLERQLLKFCEAMSIKQQPSKKLGDAILEAIARQPLDARLAALVLEDVPKQVADHRVELGGRFALLRIKATIIDDQFRLVAKTSGDNALKPATSPDKQAMSLLKDCKVFVEQSSADSLFRFAILGSLIYARIARLIQTSERSRTEAPKKVAEYMATAKSLLDSAELMCNSPFTGADQLRKDVEAAQRLLGREWYEPVTKEELDAIRSAMVSGGGITTHSGHWYKCPNGHTVRGYI